MRQYPGSCAGAGGCMTLRQSRRTAYWTYGPYVPELSTLGNDRRPAGNSGHAPASHRAPTNNTLDAIQKQVNRNTMKRRKPSTTGEPKDQTRIAAIEKTFTPEECLRLIADFTPHLQPALIETMNLAQSANIRKSSAFFVAPDKSTSWVFERLAKTIRGINDTVYGFAVSQFREGFQFTRYEVGEYYGPHFDIGPGKLTERKLSLTVQLSNPEAYSGGELIIYPEFVAPKDQGTMTVFPSFMCHDVRPVLTGTRYSLVSWLAGPPFR